MRRTVLEIMKIPTLFLWVAVLMAGLTAASAQPVITDQDMTYKIGEYYRAYSNKKGALVDVSSLIGKKGGPQFWDFASGPTNEVFLYEYVDPKSAAFGALFPAAKIAERKTSVSSGDQAWLFYEHVPNVGRTVYGARSNEGLFLSGELVFGAPVVDFPAQIRLGDQWSNLVTFTNDLDLLGDAFSIRILITSRFSADAYGVVDLPKIGFGDALRINQLDEIQMQLFTEDEEGNGSFNNLGNPVFSRFYYWIMPGRGIVATIASETTGTLEGNATPPPDNFARADFFVRMFETNRKPNEGCDTPGPVSDLRITVDSRGRALLRWTASACTSQYRVEQTSSLAPGSTWVSLATTPANFHLDEESNRSGGRYYRVVSLK